MSASQTNGGTIINTEAGEEKSKSPFTQYKGGTCRKHRLKGLHIRLLFFFLSLVKKKKTPYKGFVLYVIPPHPHITAVRKLDISLKLKVLFAT